MRLVKKNADAICRSSLQRGLTLLELIMIVAAVAIILIALVAWTNESLIKTMKEKVECVVTGKKC